VLFVNQIHIFKFQHYSILSHDGSGTVSFHSLVMLYIIICRIHHWIHKNFRSEKTEFN
jgi:hypothetical protein